MPLLPAAVGIVLNEDQTEILLVKRKDVPVWVLPGGGVEAFEKTEEALLREIYEETGFAVQISRKCAEYYPINRLAAFTTVFLCKILSGKARLSEETNEIAFHPLSKLPSLFFPPHAYWLKEALIHDSLVQRPLDEISYYAVASYMLRHPWIVLRYLWTRFFKKK